jgi:hypothetical protein
LLRSFQTQRQLDALRRTVVGVLATLIWLSSTSGAAAADQVVIKAYNTYGLPEHAARTVSRTVHRLFTDAGIETKWRHCRVVGRRTSLEQDPCSNVLAPNELIVRIVGGAAVGSGDPTMALGDAFIDPVTRQGALATVYVDRVAAVAATLGVDVGTMVGRAVTHELAHLLLGTHTHSAAGLMRATWRSMGLLRTEETDWLFTPEQRTVLRVAVADRSAKTTRGRW